MLDVVLFRPEKKTLSEFWKTAHEMVDPVINEACEKWAETPNQLKACKHFIRSSIWEEINASFQAEAGLRQSERFCKQQEGEVPVILPEVNVDSQIKKDLHARLVNMCKYQDPKERFSCITLQVTNVMRGYIAGALVTSKPPPELELPTKKKKPGKIELTPIEEVGFDAGRRVGEEIREACEGMAQKVATGDDRKYVYYACRLNSVYRTMPQAIPFDLLPKRGTPLDEQYKEARQKIGPFRLFADNLLLDTFEKASEQVEQTQTGENMKCFLAYHVRKKIARAFASTFGSATR